LFAELAARVEHREDDLERRFARIFGMRSTGMPRPLSTMVMRLPGCQRHVDARGVAGDRLVHRIVEHFGGEMVERALVDAADIHARAAADGFKTLEHLDRGGVIIM
jgi:hypothetical protein